MQNKSSPNEGKGGPKMGSQPGSSATTSTVLAKPPAKASEAELTQRILGGQNGTFHKRAFSHERAQCTHVLDRPFHLRDRMPVSVYVLEANPLAAEHLLRILSKDSQFAVTIVKNVLSCFQPLQHQKSVLVISEAGISSPLPVFVDELEQSFPDSDLVFVGELGFRRELQKLTTRKRSGFVSYADVAKKLLPVIRTFASRLSPQSVLLDRIVGAAELPEQMPGRQKMTRREIEILELLQYRLSNKEIASTLNVAEATVKFHISNILSKAGVEGKCGLLTLLDDGLSAVLQARGQSQ